MDLKGIFNVFLKSICCLSLLLLTHQVESQEVNKDDLRNRRVTNARGGEWISGGIYTGYTSVGQYGSSSVLTVTDGQTELKGSFGFVIPLFNLEENNAPIAIVPSSEVFYNLGSSIELNGFDPDDDEITFEITGNPMLGDLTAVEGSDYEFQFSPSSSLAAGSGYKDTIRFKVNEVEGELSSEVATFPFTFNVEDKPHAITDFQVITALADSKTLGLSFEDDRFNSSYDVKISYIDLSQPGAVTLVTLVDQTYKLADLTASGNKLTVNVNAAKAQFPYLFSASQVFITAEVSVNNGYEDDEAFVLSNSADGSSSGAIANSENTSGLFDISSATAATGVDTQTSADGQFFTFATRKSTPENQSVELNLYAVELGAFDLTKASIEIPTLPKTGSNESPVKVKSTANLVQWSVKYKPKGEKGYLDSLQFAVNNTGRGFTSKSYAVVQVVDVNDPPTMSDIPNQQLDEDGSLTLTLAFADVDSDLTVTAKSSDNTKVGTTVNGNQLTITPAANFNGNANISVQVSETGTTEAYSVIKSFTVNVLPVNDAPIIADINDVTIDEDNSGTINILTTDVDSKISVFNYTVTPDKLGVVDVSFSGNTMKVTPKPNYNGTVSFSVKADDRLGTDQSISQPKTFNLVINPVNDVPIVEQVIPTQKVLKSFPTYTLELGRFFQDVETTDANLTYSLSNSSLFTLTEANGVLSISPNNVAAGNESVTITASDGTASVSQSVSFVLEELAADIQVANPISNRNENEDFGQVSFDISNVFTDVNDANAVFTYEVTGNSSIGASISADGKSIVLTSPQNYSGTEKVFLVGKTGAKSGFVSFDITVSPVNDAPTLGTVSNQTVQEDFALNGLFVSYEDIDNSLSEMSFTASSSNQNLIKDGAITLTPSETGVLVSLNPEVNKNGVAAITLNASDGNLSASRTFDVTVQSVNDIPTVVSTTMADATEDVAYTVDLSTLFNDVDNDKLTFTFENKPTWLTFSGNQLAGTPSNENVGTATFFVTADDGSGGKVRQPYSLNTINVNDAPTLVTALPTINATEDVLLSVALNEASFLDVDGDNLTYSATFSGNSWLSFDAATKRFTGTPSNDNVGDVTVTVTATDGSNESVSATFQLKVINVNDAPTDITIPTLTIAENASLGAVLSALSTADVDAGDVHTYTLVSGEGSDDNSVFSINNSNLLTASAIDFESKSSLKIRLKSADGSGASIEKAFVVTVTNVNESPEAIVLSASSIEENKASGTVIGALTTTDPDNGDSHTYSFVAGAGDTDNALFEISEGNLVNKSAFNYEAKTAYSVRIKTTDADGLNFIQNFTVSVQDVNEAPSAVALSNLSVLENEDAGTLVGNLSTTDQDAADSHTYAFVSGEGDGDNSDFIINGNQLVTAQTFDREAKGAYTVRVSTTDGGGLSIEKSFTIEISNVAEPNLKVEGDLSFNQTDIGMSSELTFTITNNGDGDGLEVTNIQVPEGFSVDKSTVSLSAGASEEVKVTFSPTEGKTYNGQISISSNAGTESLNVLGEGAVVTDIDDDLIDQDEVQLYPNPSRDIVTIDLSLAPVVTPDVAIVDINGNTVWSLSKVKERKVQVTVSQYPAGTYLVRISSEKGSVIKKLMIIK